MTAVADAGPLIALAKIDGLQILPKLYPRVLTPEAVFEEAVVAGRQLGAPDVVLLEEHYRQGFLVQREPEHAPAELLRAEISDLAQLGRGEIASIALALDLNADWLLIDDRAARVVAEQIFEAKNCPSRAKGTLGVLVTAYSIGASSLTDTLAWIDRIESRPDIWISSHLCRQAAEALLSHSRQS
ncbi:MAG: hypothetical protein MI919_05005 [Holophagales bacterium]|nr:hypothetical protein [Holophagales bacterium]